LLDLTFLGLNNALFEDIFVQKYFLVEKENAELKFANKLFELQLSTLKNKKKHFANDNLFENFKEIFSQLEIEFRELVCDQERVAARLKHILELLNFCQSMFA